MSVEQIYPTDPFLLDPSLGFSTYAHHPFANYDDASFPYTSSRRIPVVACFMPSHFHVLGNPNCGYLAHTTQGWLRGLRGLCSSAQKRQKVADAARAEFNRLYNPLDWARRLHDQLQELLESKR